MILFSPRTCRIKRALSFCAAADETLAPLPVSRQSCMRDPVSMYSRVPTSSEDGGAAATAAPPRASDAALAPPLAAVPAPAEPAAPAGALQPVYVVAGFIVGVLLLVGSLAALLIPASGPGLLYAFVGFAGAQLVLVSTRAVRAGACAGVDMRARCCRRRCCCCCARAAAATPSDDDGSGGGGGSVESGGGGGEVIVRPVMLESPLESPVVAMG